MPSPLWVGHMVFPRSAYRLFPDSLAQPVAEDEVTENWSVMGMCPVTVQGRRTGGSEMPELCKVMVLLFNVYHRSPGKYNGWEQQVLWQGVLGFVL